MKNESDYNMKKVLLMLQARALVFSFTYLQRRNLKLLVAKLLDKLVDFRALYCLVGGELLNVLVPDSRAEEDKL